MNPPTKMFKNFRLTMPWATKKAKSQPSSPHRSLTSSPNLDKPMPPLPQETSVSAPATPVVPASKPARSSSSHSRPVPKIQTSFLQPAPVLLRSPSSESQIPRIRIDTSGLTRPRGNSQPAVSSPVAVLNGWEVEPEQLGYSAVPLPNTREPESWTPEPRAAPFYPLAPAVKTYTQRRTSPTTTTTSPSSPPPSYAQATQLSQADMFTALSQSDTTPPKPASTSKTGSFNSYPTYILDHPEDLYSLSEAIMTLSPVGCYFSGESKSNGNGNGNSLRPESLYEVESDDCEFDTSSSSFYSASDGSSKRLSTWSTSTDPASEVDLPPEDYLVSPLSPASRGFIVPF